MGEWCELLKNIKSNKDSFSKLLDNMNPLISKYVRLLYKNDREDIRQELILALWESILKMKYYNSDGECLSYLNNALKNKFLDLYRKSKKQNEIISIEIDETFEFPSLIESSYEFTELIFREDIKQILRNTNGKNKKYLIRFC
ncbi:MAG: sigma-70 family RNA polymerase sigma factor [Lachnospiraceae bacterium]|nr:sigma-70 family RNA polymerase sigma factor [Lachnospiraceae bacterium]